MPIHSLLSTAFCARAELFDEQHRNALRLFNGFYEGEPNLVIDLYATTAVLYNYADLPFEGAAAVRAGIDVLRAEIPWAQTMIVKTRNGTPEEKRGVVVYGNRPDTRIVEHGVRYSVNLTMNQDASLYLDTRNLRKWAIENLAGKTVLNTFAYTGSLGVAAQAGGAARVVHVDREREFLNVAKTSYTLNGFPIEKRNFLAEDFFPAVSRFRREGISFDCVFLDPPFFSVTGRGRVDLEGESERLINKVRPLVRNGGWLVVVNNALFVPGRDLMALFERLSASGYLAIETILPVPQDFTGYPHTCLRPPPVDPAPYNHPTKITVLRVWKEKQANSSQLP
ncbi:MAG: class I SAM-dependent methyltransferase [Anaerolineales bacterium]|nr:class I SAM-dependent methyltransferase [Anaerolineales bacterium]MCX7756175.1 class I SAM-dependent methyltransferase [Anaerolineales bacterium]MDW8276923.1 class I SAM-dependent methyltransferase [Anaerolineales bacterium]